MTWVNKNVRVFLRSEDGNMTVFSVFMLVLIIGITGASVDIMRIEAVRTKMQSTMDRAVLAAADLDQQQDPVAVVNDYMAKAGMPQVLSSVDVDQTPTARTVAATGAAELETIFLHMSGFDKMTAPAASTAEEKISNVEVSLVLDISGSMRFNDRISKMKPAAQAFVNKVMTDESNGVTTLNVVPFAGHVNPGDILFDYYRGERPTLPRDQNNGWGNGDQDAPGNSLCNNNAENADEGAADPSCSDATAPADPITPANGEDYFTPWSQAISNIVFYFDTDDDGIYNRAYKIEDFPESAARDADEFFEGAVAYIMAHNSELNAPEQFLGASIKGGREKTRYFQVQGDENGPASDLGPTKNKGRIPGSTYSYNSIDYAAWEPDYVSPNPEPQPETTETTETTEPTQNINMPGSCIEIYNEEFATSAMPLTEDYVPHFSYWPIDPEVMDWGWCPGEDTAIQYYSDNADALVDFIGDMRMHDGTGIQYGMKYGLALLDPATAPAVSHLISEEIVNANFEGRPLAWNDPETEKYIVIMTDGETTDQYRPVKPKAAVNGEIALSEQSGQGQEQGAYTMSPKTTNISNLHEQCDLARELGVTVFTVAFETNDAAAADMRDCASSQSHFFRVEGNEIHDAFDTIARQINNLRLIQ